MRFLFTTWAWPAHYLPMVPLAWALRAAGHDVRMTSQPELLPVMRASGLPWTVIGRDVDIAAAYRTRPTSVRDTAGPPPGKGGGRLSDQLVTGGRPDLEAVLETLRGYEDETIALFRARWATSTRPRPWRLSLYGEVAEAMADDLLALARSWRPDVIVYDALTFAGPLVARLTGVPAVRSLFGPDATYFMKVNGMGDLLERFGLADADVDPLGTATVDPCPSGLQFPDDLVPTRRLRTRFVPYPGLAEVPTLERSVRRRICLTWGTSVDRLLGTGAFLPGELVGGCAKLADERDAELVLAITARQRPYLRDLPANVRVVESVPLDVLLPTCDAVVHQGGAGTMLTGLRYGLPQLVVTQMLDQAANAYQLVASGAGATLPATGLTATDLLATGHALLDDPRYRAGAQALRQQMEDLPTPADVVPDLMSSHLRSL